MDASFLYNGSKQIKYIENIKYVPRIGERVNDEEIEPAPTVTKVLYVYEQDLIIIELKATEL